MTTEDGKDLVTVLRAIAIKWLARDPRTGQRYALGFDAEGNPYRSFSIDKGYEGAGDEYEVAS